MADEAAARTGGGLQRAVLWLVIAALLATVWVLASERNERHYRVVTENAQLIIERGRFFPMGTAPSGDAIYAPIALPAGEKPQAEMEFDDQNALDRYLFGLLTGWGREAAKKNDTHAASLLAERASGLPGLTGAQIAELTTLKAGLAWDDAQSDLAGAVKLLDAARGRLEQVKQHNGPHAADAAQLQPRIAEVAAKLNEVAKPAK